MQRVYVSTTFSGNSATIEDLEIVHRLSSVLRMKAGDQFFVFDDTSSEYLTEITTIDKKKVSVGFVKKISRETESVHKLHLYPALFKKQRFEWMIEKCTELGVVGFYPVAAEHSVVQEREDSSAAERWNRIVISAAEQSERVVIPKIYSTQTLTAALQSAPGKILVAAERSGGSAKWSPITEETSLFIGPEGGWSTEELDLFENAGATFLSFGKRILRAETACIAGSALLLTNS